MHSGKRERVMISCVTFETEKVVKPVLYYETGRVHLIHYVKDSKDETYKVYQDFYDEVSARICGERGYEVIEHCEKVYDFSSMLRTVLGILLDEREKSGPDAELFVNLSSGTSEYVSAATVASMMIQNTVPFTVGTAEYTTSLANLEKLYYENGKPIGLSKKVHEPRMIPTYRIDLPDENLVMCLREYDNMVTERLPLTAKSVIDRFKEKNLWGYESNKMSKKTDIRQKEIMYYQRHYLEAWTKMGWIEKDRNRNKYAITDLGRTVLTTFFVESG